MCRWIFLQSVSARWVLALSGIASLTCDCAGLAKASIRRESTIAALALDHAFDASIAFRGIHKSDAEACTQLTNRGSYFTAAIAVGSKNHSFDVVADTGSNAVIVADCRCSGHTCPEEQNCFNENKSESLSIFEHNGTIPYVDMTFGSGQIAAIIASDSVAVGSRRVMMNNALLLMIARNLTINGTFDGILGLGIPLKKRAESKTRHQSNRTAYHMTGFMERDQVGRFSMCFVDNGNGTLHVDAPALVNPLRSVGINHWGLDFRGISIGESSEEAQALFCKEADMQENQKTPCGAIPDSGTTLITAPATQLKKLYEHLCENWQRCKDEAANHTGIPKEDVFFAVLLNCSNWMDTDSTNPVHEMPNLTFHLRDKGGKTQKLVFEGNDYVEVVATENADFLASRTTHTEESVFAFIERHRHDLGTPQLACIPAMGSMTIPMITQENGPIWILGTPLFYAYKVNYDLSEPPSMSFEKGKCDPCSTSPGLIEAQVAPTGSASLRRHSQSTSGRPRPRKISGPPRWPTHPFVGPL